MQILWVEDKLVDIEGLRKQCELKGWKIEHKCNFWKALDALADGTEQYDVVVVDTILPAGNLPEAICDRYMPRKGGKLLLEIMRGVGEGQELLNKLSFKKDIHLKYVEMPVIMLSRIQDCEEECRDLGIVEFFPKSDYDWRSLIKTLEAFAKD